MLRVGDSLTIPVLASGGVLGAPAVRSYTVVVERIERQQSGDIRYYVRNNDGVTVGILASTVTALRERLWG